MDDARLSGGPRRAVWITRALPGAHGTAQAVAALGFEPVVDPLIEARPLPVAVPSLAGVGALAFTSATAVRAFAALHGDRALPVFAVGDATAAAARAAGWTKVRSAAGDVVALDALLAREAPAGRVLAPGARRPAGELRHAERLAIYETAPTPGPWPLAAAAADRLRAVLVHSPSAARALAASGPARRGAEALALSPACADPLLAQGWSGAVRVAHRPDEPALLALLCAPPSPSAPWRPPPGSL